MECNKDEAIRAKVIAVKRMENNDFEGAHRIAMKARQLFPEIKNINQLLTVCNVHCAAKIKILGSEKDFYGMLQLDKFSDEVAIRKQYRKLALTLHPDKNKLPGAEAAFKLVGEATVMLLDPGKKALYDNGCRASVRTVQTKQFSRRNRNQTTSTPSVVQGRRRTTSTPSVVQGRRRTTSTPSRVQGPFWTTYRFRKTTSNLICALQVIIITSNILYILFV